MFTSPSTDTSYRPLFVSNDIIPSEDCWVVVLWCHHFPSYLSSLISLNYIQSHSHTVTLSYKLYFHAYIHTFMHKHIHAYTRSCICNTQYHSYMIALSTLSLASVVSHKSLISSVSDLEVSPIKYISSGRFHKQSIYKYIQFPQVSSPVCRVTDVAKHVFFQSYLHTTIIVR